MAFFAGVLHARVCYIWLDLEFAPTVTISLRRSYETHSKYSRVRDLRLFMRLRFTIQKG